MPRSLGRLSSCGFWLRWFISLRACVCRFLWVTECPPVVGTMVVAGATPPAYLAHLLKTFSTFNALQAVRFALSDGASPCCLQLLRFSLSGGQSLRFLQVLCFSFCGYANSRFLRTLARFIFAVARWIISPSLALRLTHPADVPRHATVRGRRLQS